MYLNINEIVHLKHCSNLHQLLVKTENNKLKLREGKSKFHDNNELCSHTLAVIRVSMQDIPLFETQKYIISFKNYLDTLSLIQLITWYRKCFDMV